MKIHIPLLNILTDEEIVFSRAVSICSVIIEMGLCRASIEDVIDGLYNRFIGAGETIDRDHLQSTTQSAIDYALTNGMIERRDTDTFSLSDSGTFYGTTWLKLVTQSA